MQYSIFFSFFFLTQTPNSSSTNPQGNPGLEWLWPFKLCMVSIHFSESVLSGSSCTEPVWFTKCYLSNHFQGHFYIESVYLKYLIICINTFASTLPQQGKRGHTAFVSVEMSSFLFSFSTPMLPSTWPWSDLDEQKLLGSQTDAICTFIRKRTVKGWRWGWGCGPLLH